MQPARNTNENKAVNNPKKEYFINNSYVDERSDSFSDLIYWIFVAKFLNFQPDLTLDGGISFQTVFGQS